MRSTFGHDGDLVEAIREIYDHSREAATRRRLIELVEAARGTIITEANLIGYWPTFDSLKDRLQRTRTDEYER